MPHFIEVRHSNAEREIFDLRRVVYVKAEHKEPIDTGVIRKAKEGLTTLHMVLESGTPVMLQGKQADRVFKLFLKHVKPKEVIDPVKPSA
jgi:hypothetical protein